MKAGPHAAEGFFCSRSMYLYRLTCHNLALQKWRQDGWLGSVAFQSPSACAKLRLYQHSPSNGVHCHIWDLR